MCAIQGLINTVITGTGLLLYCITAGAVPRGPRGDRGPPVKFLPPPLVAPQKSSRLGPPALAKIFC